MKISFFVLLFGFTTNVYSFTSQEVAQAKRAMINRSISGYSGNCPCPYNTMRNGRSCGKRSAYSRPGGASPLCYISDISDAEAKKYLESVKGNVTIK